MKKRNGMRTAALLVAAAVMVSTGTTSFAAGSNYSSLIGGTKTTSIDKYLVMDTDATVPNVTFTYTVAAGTADTYEKTNTADDGTTTKTTTKVLAGVDANSVTVTGTDVTADSSTTANGYKLTFSSTDSTASDAYTGSESFIITSQKYVKKTLTLDFSNCKFTEPGIYRYTLTESNTDAQGITYDANLVRYIDVYVIDDSTEENGTTTEKKLKVNNYIVYTNSDALADGSTSTSSTTSSTGNKSTSFTNTYDTANLTFRKEVSGNQASKDKYFKFTVTIDNAVQNTVYIVDINQADGTPLTNSATTYTSMTNNVGSGETAGKLIATTQSSKYKDKYCVEAEFYLQDGQEITIKGLAKDTVYTVTEANEGYTSEGAAVDGYKNPTSGTIGNTLETGTNKATTATTVNDVKTSYLNTLAGTIPTGIILTIAPFAAAVLIGGAGLIAIMVKKNRRRED